MDGKPFKQKKRASGQAKSRGIALLAGVLACMFVMRGYAQTTDRKQNIKVSLDTEWFTNMGYEASFQDNPVGKGTIRNASKTGVRLSVPVLSGKYGLCSVGGYYTLHHADFDGAEDFGAAFPVDMGLNHHLVGLRVNGFFRFRLFGKPFTAFTHMMAEGYEQGFGSVTGYLVGIWQLKRTPRSSFGVGMVGLVNTTSPWPLFPVLTYRYRFSEKWQVEVMPPPVSCDLFVQSHRPADRRAVHRRRSFLCQPPQCLSAQDVPVQQKSDAPGTQVRGKLGQGLQPLCAPRRVPYDERQALQEKQSYAGAGFRHPRGAFWSVQLTANLF